MNLANKITLFRVICIPVFIIFMYMDGMAMALAALAVYVLGSVSDFVDGYVARKYNMITDFGGAANYSHASEIIKYGLIIVSSIPMMIVYPFVQKHFVKGVMIGSIKG